MHISVIVVITASLAFQHLLGLRALTNPLLSMAGIVAAQVTVLLSAVHVVRCTSAELGAVGEEAVLQRLDARLALHRVVWLGACLLVLTCFQWPQLLATSGPSIFMSRILILVPVLAPLMGSWAIFFDIERKLDPNTGSLGRWNFVRERTRMGLALPLVMILFAVLCQDLIDTSVALSHHRWAVVLRILPLTLAAVAFPVFLKQAWKTESLHAGELRSELERHCDTFGFVARDILIWKTDDRIRNAAVTGVIQPWRYVLLTDRLLKELPTKYIECVFLHEVGHAKHGHHLRLVFVAFFVFACGLGAASLGITASATNWWYVAAAASGLVAALALFGHIARLFELQADLWAVQHIGKSPWDYLRAIAMVSGGDPDGRTWMHPSFQQRCDFLLAGVESADRCLRRRLRFATLGVVILSGFFGLMIQIAQ